MNCKHQLLAQEHKELKRFVTIQLGLRARYVWEYQMLLDKENKTPNDIKRMNVCVNNITAIRDNLRWANRRLLLVKREIREVMQEYNKFQIIFKF